MREECPVCKSKNRVDDWSLYFEVPDGWSLSKENKVCGCLNCGFIYFDNNSTQEDYNKYYLDHYGKGMDRYENYIRLDSLAAQISDYFKDKSIRIRDFGVILFRGECKMFYDIGSTKPITMVELARAVAKRYNTKCRIVIENGGDPVPYYMPRNMTKTHNLIFDLIGE